MQGQVRGEWHAIVVHADQGGQGMLLHQGPSQGVVLGFELQWQVGRGFHALYWSSMRDQSSMPTMRL